MRQPSCRPAPPRRSTPPATSSLRSTGSDMNRTAFDDPILLELVRYSLDAIADEMSLVLVRTAYSINLKSTMDMCCAICDADGRLLVQGLTLPLHLGSIPAAIRAVLAKFKGRIHE